MDVLGVHGVLSFIRSEQEQESNTFLFHLLQIRLVQASDSLLLSAGA